jgi:hypothetical protein
MMQLFAMRWPRGFDYFARHPGTTLTPPILSPAVPVDLSAILYNNLLKWHFRTFT